MLRRAVPLATVLAALAACTDVTQEPLPSQLVFARFSSPNIPTPNDLALAALVSLQPANGCASPIDACSLPPAAKNAQIELLCAFRQGGGFPADQEVPISVPFTAVQWNPAAGTNGAYLEVAAPALDLSTVTAQTVTVLRVDVSPPAAVEWEASSAAGSCAATPCTPATLTIRKKASAGSRRWDAGGRYVVAVRGGPSGVKTTTGQPVQADSAVALAIPNRDLTKKENQPLGAIPDSSPAGSCGAGTNADEIGLLEAVRGALWNPLTWSQTASGWTPAPSATVTPAFTAVDAAFPLEETASIATFGVAPSAGTVVLIDSGSGVAPLPIDLLRTDPDGTVVNNPAFGPAAEGIDTLDGFSTTAMMLAQTSAPVDASTVNGANVFVYRLENGTATLVKELKRELGAAGAGDPTADPFDAGYVAQPSQIVLPQGPACPIAGGCSPAIGLQPAVPAPVTGVGTFYLPPLSSDSLYAVVVTNRVKDVFGVGLVRPSVGKILLEFTTPFVVNGASTIPGVAASTAQALEDMRAALAPVWAALPAGTTKQDVAVAYTFKTQSIEDIALRLAAIPYSVESGTGIPYFAPSALAEIAAPPGVPTANVAHFYDVSFSSIDAIDKVTGALNPGLGQALGIPESVLTTLHALVAVPDPAVVPACPTPPFPAGARCARLVVFGHGLGQSKENLFATASSLASQGFVAAAIDFPMHGGRAWCKADAECGAGGVCTPFIAGYSQPGDTAPAGVCTAGAPLSAISGQFFVSANFFRTRDAFRQNLIDQSALVLALARPPTLPDPGIADVFRSTVGAQGIVVDPTTASYEGISLGSISGTSVVATNPRLSRAAFSVGGGTVTDVFTNSPAFQAQVDALFAGLIPGFSRAAITPGDPAFNPAVASAYLQLLNVAKWILDPGDPINYAKHLSIEPLPNLLADPLGSVLQAPKSTFAQVALGDTVVPNGFNLLLDTLSGSATTVYSDDDPPGGPAPHGMLGTIPAVQLDAALFLLDGTTPPPTKTITVP